MTRLRVFNAKRLDDACSAWQGDWGASCRMSALALSTMLYCYYFLAACPATAFRLPARSNLTGTARILRASPTSSSVLSASRKPLVGGNWKSNGSVESSRKLVDLLNNKLSFKSEEVEVVVAPPAIHLCYARDKLKPPTQLAAQNIALHKGYGAYTGEISGEMIKDFGIDWTLTGHSERREGFGMAGESSELVGRKTKAAIDQGLKVIVCIGEKLPEREAGRTVDVLSEQLEALKTALETRDMWAHIVIAYEPVWAIGTGATATPDMAQQTHKDIRQWLSDNISPEVAAATRILYGGSVKGSNARELCEGLDIDGFLVGGASLKEEFVTIVNAATKNAPAVKSTV